MSGFQTHAFVGAVSGLVLVTALNQFQPGLIPAQVGGVPALPWLPGGSGGTAVIVASAALALLPDIDEPNSFVARRVRAVLPLALGLLGLGLGILVGTPLWLPLALGLLGALIGVGLAPLLLKTIRTAAGGHRRFTHSFVLAGLFLALAGGLFSVGADLLWLVPAALAWGIVTHVLADVVTPAGVPLLYPFSDASVRVLPEPICRAGESLVWLAALAVAWVILA